MALGLLAVAASACNATRHKQPALATEEGRASQGGTAREVAWTRLHTIEAYEIGGTTYAAFRASRWPSYTILHMDVRSGAPATADAVVVLGIAGGEATGQGGPEQLIEAILDQSDDRGVCIVRGWLEGERYVAALPDECPNAIRDELDGILDEFDAMTGGDAVWILRFEDGLLRSRERL